MNISKLLFAVLGLAVSCVVPEGNAGETPKSWAEQGKIAGLKIAAILGKAETVMQEVFLHFAKQIAGTPSAEDWLTGYSQAFEVEQTRKNRKSEANAVFKAWASNHSVERVDLSCAENIELAKKGTPVKVSKTTREWLEGYKGGYHGFIQLARDMAPKSTSDASKTGTTKVRTLTEKTAKKMVEEMAFATPQQADAVITASIAKVKALPGATHKMFGHIIGLCNEIKAISNNVAELDAASAIIDTVAGLMKATPGTGAATAAIPAPAESPKVVVEQSAPAYVEPSHYEGMSTEELAEGVRTYGNAEITAKAEALNSRAGWCIASDKIEVLENSVEKTGTNG